MTSACLPSKRKCSPIAAPANGAIHLIGAASAAGAETMIVYSIAPSSRRRSYTCATVDALLADRDVDADHVAADLVEDRVDDDRRLAGLAVADDQLALAAADVRHRVDRLDPGLERLLHRLPLDDARRLELERPAFRRLDRALPVERVAERVDDAAEERLSDGHGGDLAAAADGLALLDVLPLAEERGADVVLLEVQGDADDAVLELEHLERERVLEAVHAGDPVADLEDGADLGQVGLDVVLLDPLLAGSR